MASDNPQPPVSNKWSNQDGTPSQAFGQYMTKLQRQFSDISADVAFGGGGSMPNVRKSFYHIQRIGGGLAGTYMPIDPNDVGSTPGGAFFITDPPVPLPLGSFIYPLPTWMPRQVYISRVLVAYAMDIFFSDFTGYGSLNDLQKQSEVSFLLNKKGIDDQALGGTEGTADFTRDVSLIQYQTADPVVFIDKDFNVPTLWDRDAGDLIMLEISLVQKIPWIYSEIQFLVPTTKPVTDTGSGY